MAIKKRILIAAKNELKDNIGKSRLVRGSPENF
jgi:hypothetical protein